MFEIMFDDLKPEAQKRLLEYMGIKDPSEGNYEIVPIAEVDYNDKDNDEREEADEEVCLKEDEYTNEPDGCLLVDPDILYYVEPDSTVDVSFEVNPNHHEIFRVRADKGPYGETILEPIDDEDEEEDETVTSRSVDCPCDCTECEYAEKCTENGRYDFSDS